MKRRTFLELPILGGLFGQSFFSRPTFASPLSQNIIFIFNQGGWDPTRVFASEFDNALVAMEPLAQANNIGNLSWVSHPNRPSVDNFFQSHYEQSLILNGLQVRSIAHEICTCLAFTGGISGSNADWATIIAAQEQGNFAIPHLVLGGPSFSGTLGASVVQTGRNNQLESILDGSIVDLNNEDVALLGAPTKSLMDAHIQKRGHARAQQAQFGADRTLSTAYQSAIDNARLLQRKRYLMEFRGGSLANQVDCAVDALSQGISKCVSLVHVGDGLGWDSHANNDDTQSTLFENLFAELNILMHQLQNRTDQNGVTLSTNTTVVVFSEMGRSASLNGTLGKDHWPYTSMLIWGNGITGNRMVGAFDQRYQGSGVDLLSGELSPSANTLSVESIGAALLALGGVDPTEHIPDADPLLGILQ